jgi:hypothetical protein
VLLKDNGTGPESNDRRAKVEVFLKKIKRPSQKHLRRFFSFLMFIEANRVWFVQFLKKAGT